MSDTILDKVVEYYDLPVKKKLSNEFLMEKICELMDKNKKLKNDLDIDNRYLDNVDKELKDTKEKLATFKGYMKNAIAPIYTCTKCGFKEVTFRGIDRCCKCDHNVLEVAKEIMK